MKGCGGEPHRRTRQACGFTLAEVLVAIALLLVLLGSVLAFASNVSASRERLAAGMAREQGLRAFFDRLEADLNVCVASEAVHGSGVVGGADSLSLLARGVAVSPLLAPDATTAAALRDLQRAEYRWDDGGRVLEARRGAPDGSDEWWPVLEGIARVRWRFHDGSRWSDSFESGAANRLPAAIEVAIWFTLPVDDFATPSAAVESASEFSEFPDEGGDRRGVAAGPNDAGFGGGGGDALGDEPPPDRVRLFVIPDGPEFEYGRSFQDTDEDGVEP